MKLIKYCCLISLFALMASLSGCVSTKTVAKSNTVDSELTCDSIAVRIGEVRGAKAYAQANQGVSGANVAAALLFLPALLVNNANTSEMINSMNEREATLNGLYTLSTCSDDIPQYDVKEMKKKLKSGDTLESFG